MLYAARLGESAMETVLGWLLRAGEVPTVEVVEALLLLPEPSAVDDVHITEVELEAYDRLLEAVEVSPC